MTDNAPSSGGNFSYPQGEGVQFNYIDSVVTSWTTFDPNATACVVSLWYWVDSGTQEWKISLNQSAPANATKVFPLDVASEPYLGQFNLNYTAANRSRHLFLGPIFHVNHDSTQPTAVTWNQGALSTTSPPLTSQGSVATAMPTSTSSADSLSMSNSPSQLNSSSTSQISWSGSSSSTLSASPAANASGLSGGAIAGIVVGIVISVGLCAALLMRLRVRRREPVEPKIHPLPLDDSHLLHEVDGRSRPQNELSGNGDRWELPTNRK